MGYYSRGIYTDRAVRGSFLKMLGIPALLLLGLALTLFFYCDGRVDRTVYERALDRASGAITVRELEMQLLPAFQKSQRAPHQIVYVARPTGKGVCGCAPAMTEVVVVTCDDSGQIVRLDAHERLGLSTRAR